MLESLHIIKRPTYLMTPTVGSITDGGSDEQVDSEVPNLNPSFAKFPTFRQALAMKNGITTTDAPIRPT